MSVLPKYLSSDGCRPDRRPFSRRRAVSLFAAAAVLSTCALAWTARFQLGWPKQYPVPPPGTSLPPLYSEYHEAELRLPQQSWNSTRPRGDEGFFFVAGHVRGSSV